MSGLLSSSGVLANDGEGGHCFRYRGKGMCWSLYDGIIGRSVCRKTCFGRRNGCDEIYLGISPVARYVCHESTRANAEKHMANKEALISDLPKGVIAGTLTCNFWRLCTRVYEGKGEICGEIRGEPKERVNVCSFLGRWLLSSQSVKCQLFNCLIVCLKNEGE